MSLEQWQFQVWGNDWPIVKQVIIKHLPALRFKQTEDERIDCMLKIAHNLKELGILNKGSFKEFLFCLIATR